MDTATTTTEPKEFLRYFDPARRCLVRHLDNGKTQFRRVVDETWNPWTKKKDGYTLDDWRARKIAHFRTLPVWAQDVRELPSLEELTDALSDGACETPTGDSVEPDGHGPDGAPSWLLALGLI